MEQKLHKLPADRNPFIITRNGVGTVFKVRRIKKQVLVDRFPQKLNGISMNNSELPFANDKNFDKINEFCCEQSFNHENCTRSSAVGYTTPFGESHEAEKSENKNDMLEHKLATISEQNGLNTKDETYKIIEDHKENMENPYTQHYCENSTEKRVKLNEEVESLDEKQSPKGEKMSMENPPLDLKTEQFRKTSLLLNENVGRPGRRDSVVAMSTRKVSLVSSSSKSKVRKTSFVAPKVSTRRKSTFAHKVTENNFLQRRASGNEKATKNDVEVRLTMFEFKDRVTLYVDSLLNCLHTQYPSRKVDILDSTDRCLWTSDAKDLVKEKTIDMPPRNESSQLDFCSDKPTIIELIRDVKQKPTDLQCHIEFCRKMAAFANDDSLNVLLAKQEGISYILKSVHNFRKNVELVRTACKTLQKMVAFTDANCVHLLKGNGISLLLDIFQLYIDDAGLLQIVLDIFSYLTMSENMDIVDAMLEQSCHTHILTTMSRHGESSDIAKQCCFVLSHLINSVETARSLMFIGGVHVIIGIMKKFGNENEVLENGCRALGSFAMHDDICVDVVNAGALDITLVAIKRGKDDGNLLECSTWALACLTKYDESCNEVVKAGGLHNLLQAMKAHPTRSAVQEYGCWTICNIVAQDKDIIDSFIEDSMDILLSAVNMFKENLELQEQLLYTLCEIFQSKGNSMLLKFESSNGTQAIIQVMSSFPDYCMIQEHGCRIIGNIAVHEKYRISVERNGASKVISSAMLTLDHCEELQEIGCLSLTNITANVGRNKISAVSNGCIPAVLKAMFNFKESLHIALSGIKTLCNVIEIDEACYKFLEEDGLGTVKSILEAHKNINNLSEYSVFACSTLARLSGILGIEEEYLTQAENLISEMVNVTNQEPETVICLCNFYEQLVTTEKGYRLFKAFNGLFKVSNWLSKHKSSSSITASGCKILAGVSLYDSKSCSEVLPVIKTCMCNHQEDDNIQLICCGAILYMTEHTDLTKELLLQNLVENFVLRAIRRHRNNPKLVDIGLMVLNSLFSTNSHNLDIKDMYTMAVEVLRQYPDNNEIQIHCCKLIKLLNSKQFQKLSSNKEKLKTHEQIVSLLKRRRSNSELQKMAFSVLTCLLEDEPDFVQQHIKDELAFLNIIWDGLQSQ